MELKIIKKSTKYNYSGEMIISKAEYLAAEIEFWRNVGKQIEIPGFRKGQAPESLVKAQVDPEAVGGMFCSFFQSHYYNEIFEPIRKYPQSINLDYLDSTISMGYNGQKQIEIVFILNMCGAVNLPEKFGISSKILPKKQTSVPGASFDVFKDKHELLFFAQHNNFETSKEPAKKGDILVVSGTMFLTDNPNIIIDSWQLSNVLVGVNNYLPEIDKMLTGAKPMKRCKKTFIFPKDSPTEFASQKVTCQMLVLAVEKPDYKSIDDIFAKNKDLKGITKSKLAQQITDEYKELVGERHWSQVREYVAKKLIESVPDFNPGKKVPANLLKNIGKVEPDKQGNFYVTTRWGKFEINGENKDPETAMTELHNIVSRLECVLLKIYNRHTKLLNEDFRLSQEQLEEEVISIMKSPETNGFGKNEDENVVRIYVEKYDKMESALIWITQEILDGNQVVL